MTFSNFGNPLNKLKKAKWLQGLVNTGSEIDARQIARRGQTSPIKSASSKQYPIYLDRNDSVEYNNKRIQGLHKLMDDYSPTQEKSLSGIDNPLDSHKQLVDTIHSKGMIDDATAQELAVLNKPSTQRAYNTKVIEGDNYNVPIAVGLNDMEAKDIPGIPSMANTSKSMLMKPDRVFTAHTHPTDLTAEGMNSVLTGKPYIPQPNDVKLTTNETTLPSYQDVYTISQIQKNLKQYPAYENIGDVDNFVIGKKNNAFVLNKYKMGSNADISDTVIPGEAIEAYRTWGDNIQPKKKSLLSKIFNPRSTTNINQPVDITPQTQQLNTKLRKIYKDKGIELTDYDYNSSFSYMTEVITFGNPLNKIKKNKWLDSISPHTNPEDIANVRTMARENIADELYRNTEEIPETTRRQRLLKMHLDKHPESDAWRDYDTPRYDTESRQFVAFPKVNGYMEVPLPKKRFTDNYNVTRPQFEYIQKQARQNRYEIPVTNEH